MNYICFCLFVFLRCQDGLFYFPLCLLEKIKKSLCYSVQTGWRFHWKWTHVMFDGVYMWQVFLWHFCDIRWNGCVHRMKELKRWGILEGFSKFCCFDHQVIFAIFRFCVIVGILEARFATQRKRQRGDLKLQPGRSLYPDGDAGGRSIIKYNPHHQHECRWALSVGACKKCNVRMGGKLKVKVAVIVTSRRMWGQRGCAHASREVRVIASWWQDVGALWKMRWRGGRIFGKAGEDLLEQMLSSGLRMP